MTVRDGRCDECDPVPRKIAKDIEAAVRAAQLYIGKGLRMRPL